MYSNLSSVFQTAHVNLQKAARSLGTQTQATRARGAYLLQDADLQLEPVQDFRDTIDVSKQVVCGNYLFGIEMRVIFF